MAILPRHGSKVSPYGYKDMLNVIEERAQTREQILVRMAVYRAGALAMMYKHGGLGVDEGATIPINLTSRSLAARLADGTERAVRYQSEPIKVSPADPKLAAAQVVLQHTVSTYTGPLFPWLRRGQNRAIEKDDIVIARLDKPADGQHDVGLFAADFGRVNDKLGEVAHRVNYFGSRLLLLAKHAGYSLPLYDSDIHPDILAQRLDKR